MAEVIDEPPPLEDMTQYINIHTDTVHTDTVHTDNSLLRLEYNDQSSSHTTALQNELLIVNNTQHSKEHSQQHGQQHCKEHGKEHVSSKETKSSFGGMKKGFLFTNDKRTPQHSKPSVTVTARQQESIPLIKPTTSKDTLQFDEVQHEMNKSFPFLSNNKDWVTDDLLKKIDDNPILSKAFTDPKFSKALQEFHENPQESLKHASPEIRKFLQEFSSLMGDHFISLDSSQPAEPIISEQLNEDDKRMRDALSKPEIQKLLKDNEIQKLMNLLLKDINQAQQYLDSNKSLEFQSKVGVLIESGVLNVTRQ